MKAQDASFSNKFSRIAIAVAIFAIGFFTACFALGTTPNLEHPASFVSSNQVHAPSDTITEDSILVYDDKVVINLENASLSKYASSGSMLPVFDTGANGLRIKPSSPDEINLGDIITYSLNEQLIVHRVIEKGYDDEGLYFIVKGDNNSYSDGKIRFSDIKYKTVALFY
jgi:hypothetical protein